jgi:YihY family inner membrane protein
VGISRRISTKERRRLREIVDRLRPPGTGFIVRTVAENVPQAKLESDIRFLIEIWNQVVRKNEKRGGPGLMHPDLDLILRATRDLFAADVEKLVVDDREEYERILGFVTAQDPALSDRVVFHDSDEPIFDSYGIEQEIRRATQRKVWLKSGGYLIMDQAEALTAIDVNSGRYVGKKSLEETITKINMEAAKEIVYQLRLRNIGGIIICDFIDMEKSQNRDKVFKALQEALGRDKAKTNVLRISELGLVEMTRKRWSPRSDAHEDCLYCGGGAVKPPPPSPRDLPRGPPRGATSRTHPGEPNRGSPHPPERERDELRHLMDRYNKTIRCVRRARTTARRTILRPQRQGRTTRRPPRGLRSGGGGPRRRPSAGREPGAGRAERGGDRNGARGGRHRRGRDRDKRAAGRRAEAGGRRGRVRNAHPRRQSRPTLESLAGLAPRPPPSAAVAAPRGLQAAASRSPSSRGQTHDISPSSPGGGGRCSHASAEALDGVGAMPGCSHPGVAEDDAMLRGILTQASAKVAGLLGFATLIVSAVPLVQNLDGSLNQVWNVKENRPYPIRILVWLAAIIAAPLVLGVTLSATSLLHRLLVFIGVPFRSELLSIVATVIAIGTLTVLYVVTPNCKVHWRFALAGATVAGVLWSIARVLYSSFAAQTFRYGVLYGLPALPLFLLWLFVSWLLVLFGARLAYALQTARRRSIWPALFDHPLGHELAGVRVVQHLTRNWLEKEYAPSRAAMSRELELPEEVLQPVLEALPRAGHEGGTDGARRAIRPSSRWPMRSPRSGAKASPRRVGQAPTCPHRTWRRWTSCWPRQTPTRPPGSGT